MKCLHCRSEIPDDSNFCPVCAAKLRELCSCWIKKKPYNCGQNKCPGYRLIAEEVRKLKAKCL